MEYKSLGNTGLRVSVAGLGCNNFGMRIDIDKTREVLDAAIDAGINFLDTARMYGGGKSEEFMGEVLKGRREHVLLATKFGGPTKPNDSTGSRRHIVKSVETSLAALQADYIDLLQFHFPDPQTPLEETMSAMTDLVHSGKVRYIGCSNFTGYMIADSSWIARTRGFEPFASVQNEWSLLSRAIEVEVTTAAAKFGMSVLPYFPLASGVLTGKVRRGQSAPEGSRLTAAYFASALNDANFDKIDKLEAWGNERGRSLTEIALSWLASQPVVASVIAGATSAEQVRTNASLTKTDLTAAEITEISDIVGK